MTFHSCNGWKNFFHTGVLLLGTLLFLSVDISGEFIEGLDEETRLKMYEERGYVWPLPEVVPNTPGWNKLMRRRFAQIEHVEDSVDRYNAFVETLSSALVPNFTENGWGLTRAPEEIVEYLRENLHNGLEKATVEEENDLFSGTERELEEGSWQRPLFIQQESLSQLVLEELQSMHEEWSGVKLVGQTAYGLRAYRNQTILNMHVDHRATHVVSCILHVDHDKDSDPWPIFIEDFQGNTNEVVLESGDMLFYESSKCLHGRPRPFNGSWYSSIFVHYSPAGGVVFDDMEAHYAVPKHWAGTKKNEDYDYDYNDDNEDEDADDEPTAKVDNDPTLDRLQVIGESFLEPDCPDSWCAAANSVKWFGPGEKGRVISAGDRRINDNSDGL